MSTKLENKSSVEKIIEEMSLEEKASIVIGGTPFTTESMEKYGIPSALFLDGGTGVNYGQISLEFAFQEYYKACNKKPIKNNYKDGMGGLVESVDILSHTPGANESPEINQTFMGLAQSLENFKPKGDPLGCYPPGILLGATWNPRAVAGCGRELAKETDAHGVDVMLGSPNVNIHRDPRNGRLFEGYSEDPCLVSKLAPEFVKAVQNEGVVANVKHFAANNQETNRMGVNEHIPERALREIYFPGFKACVDAGCKTVMSAYNKINGKACAMNKWLLKNILVDEWGFDGLVVSDWSASYEEAESLAAGNDLIMPGPREIQPIIDAVHNGGVTESDLDMCVRHFLNLLLETPIMKGRRYNTIDEKTGNEAAYYAASEGITLLKNNGVLPLNKLSKIAFWGQRSKKMIDSGAGSANVDTPRTTSIYQCTMDKIGKQNVTFEEIKDETETIIVTVGANGQEGADRIEMDLEPEDKTLLLDIIKKVKSLNKKIIVILNIAGPIEMMEWINEVDAVICAFLPGMQGGKATSDILFGEINPSGKLPLTFPKYYRDCPTYRSFPGEYNDSWYGEGIYVGYRYYDMKQIKPLFPFGFGLSYTTFDLSDLRVPKQLNVDKDNVKLSINVKNSGSRAGSEVIQLYISDVLSSIEKPIKELKTFVKIYLDAGEEKRVDLELGKQDFASYDTKLSEWVTEPGEYEILIGNSAENIILRDTITISCKNPYQIGPNTSIGKVATSSKAVEIISEGIRKNFLEIVGTAIVFFPGYSLDEIWEISIAREIAGTDAEKQKIKNEVYTKLAQIDG